MFLNTSIVRLRLDQSDMRMLLDHMLNNYLWKYMNEQGIRDKY